LARLGTAARRTAFLWALSPLAICVIEKIAFGSTHFVGLLGYRFSGVYRLAFDLPAPAAGQTLDLSLPTLEPGRFLGTPDLWIGLAVAALFLVAAVQLRRYRTPT
jgi:ABC-2 type transport system permease protein